MSPAQEAAMTARIDAALARLEAEGRAITHKSLYAEVGGKKSDFATLMKQRRAQEMDAPLASEPAYNDSMYKDRPSPPVRAPEPPLPPDGLEEPAPPLATPAELERFLGAEHGLEATIAPEVDSQDVPDSEGLPDAPGPAVPRLVHQQAVVSEAETALARVTWEQGQRVQTLTREAHMLSQIERDATGVLRDLRLAQLRTQAARGAMPGQRHRHLRPPGRASAGRRR